MAKRRMFNVEFIESDRFTDLPYSEQSLYFHLNMIADDDGFIGNAKNLINILRLTKRQINHLIKMNYIISFDSGVIVITDWPLHNKIPKDRYTPTRYKKERDLLEIIDSSYCVKKNKSEKNQGNSDFFVNTFVTQVSIGKDSIDKDSSVQSSESETSLCEHSSLHTTSDTENADIEITEKRKNEKDEEEIFENDRDYILKRLEKIKMESESIRMRKKEIEGKKILDNPSLINDFIKKMKAYYLSNYGLNYYKDFISFYIDREFRDILGDFIFDDYKNYIDLWADEMKIPKMADKTNPS